MTMIVIAEIPQEADRDLDVEASILGPDVEFVRYANDDDWRGLVSVCRDADAIMTAFAPLNRSFIEQLNRCRMISISATGYSCVDLEAAAEAGISVCAIDDYCTNEVADHTILLMLALCRRLLDYHDQVQTEHRWEYDSLSGIPRVRDLTLGLVGFGRIGQAVARRAHGFGMTVIAHDPYVSELEISGAGESLAPGPYRHRHLQGARALRGTEAA